MKIKKRWWLLIVIIIILGGRWFIVSKSNGKSSKQTRWEEIKPEMGSIETEISTTGIVEPQNRLEVKPPIDGRVEEMLVQEGDMVEKGQILAWMSSMDRAALLDAASAQGKESVAYWQNVYKAIPLMAPISGQVIVRAVEPGQTVTSQTAVLVLSDRLIVKAQVDEADIGRVQLQQKVIVSLDAYPDENINAVVTHIAYESLLVNNVTIYEVQVLLEKVPDFCRSGMSATVHIIESQKNNAMLLPLEAVNNDKGEASVLVKDGRGPRKVKVITGIMSDTDVEIVSGITSQDIVLIKNKQFSLPNDKKMSSPFTPFSGGRRH